MQQWPKVEGAGRPPIGLPRMLHMYVAQQCFGLSEEGIEDAIYDSQAIRSFIGIDLNRKSAPDAEPLLSSLPATSVMSPKRTCCCSATKWQRSATRDIRAWKNVQKIKARPSRGTSLLQRFDSQARQPELRAG